MPGADHSQAPIYPGATQLGSGLAEKDLVLLSQTWASNVPLPQRQLVPWAALRRSDTREEMKGGDPSSLKGNLSMCVNAWKESEKRREPGPCQWCPGTDPEATGTNWNTGDSLLSIRKHFFIVPEHWRRLPREAAVSIPADIQKLPGCDPGGLLKVILEQGSWKRWLPEALSNLYHLVILYENSLLPKFLPLCFY